MQPMQPMRPMMPPMAPPPKPRPRLPGGLKALLVLKGIACFIVLALTFIAMAALNATVGKHTNALGDDGKDAMHALGQILTAIAGIQVAQIIGIAGTWGFKRWGVYVLAGFSMLDIVLNLKSNSQTGLVIGVVSTLVLAFGIVPRWKDFE
jgi:hypothetical protein